MPTTGFFIPPLLAMDAFVAIPLVMASAVPESVNSGRNHGMTARNVGLRSLVRLKLGAPMRIEFVITDKDAECAKAFYQQWENSRLVVDRYQRNVLREHPDLDEEQVWWAITLGLLTTQQRSSAGSAVSRLLNTEPYPLALAECRAHESCSSFVYQALTSFGGIRRTHTIADWLEQHLAWLDGGGWDELLGVLGSIKHGRVPAFERVAARRVQERLIGLGPKQSRNVLQVLGLTRYEIPLDSRLTKWLNDFGFPLKLSANSLGDLAVYELIEDGFQALCARIDVLPCLMDAAIFASFDPKGWGAAVR
jgi:hypothetical protein